MPEGLQYFPNDSMSLTSVLAAFPGLYCFSGKAEQPHVALMGAAHVSGHEGVHVRIALDASFLALPPSGTSSYIRHLSAALRDLEPSLQLQSLEPAWPKDGGDSMPSRRQRLDWELHGVGTETRRTDPDLLHIPHFSAPLVSVGAPLVITVHDVIPLVVPAYRASRSARARLAIMERTIRRARLILTPSHHAASDIHHVLKTPIARIRVTPLAADPTIRPMRDSVTPVSTELMRDLGVHGRYVFNIAGFDARKNLPVLIEAFARTLPHLHEPVWLVIAGAPHSANETVFPPLEPVIERHGVRGNVILTGMVSVAEKTALYQHASLYVTPSSYEGFGLTALEAMAAGVPTIGADRTSLPEVIGEGGLLVEPDAAALATAMVSVLNDSSIAARLSQAALDQAATFSWQQTARLTLEAYRDVIAFSSRR